MKAVINVSLFQQLPSAYMNDKPTDLEITLLELKQVSRHNFGGGNKQQVCCSHMEMSVAEACVPY